MHAKNESVETSSMHCRQLGVSMAVHQKEDRGALSEQSNMSCPDSLQEAVVKEIHEQHEVPDCGVFTAYRDGSVHVAFHDRALLYVKKSQEHCEVITPDGLRVTVATATPLGVEQYVAQAMEFADWAFSSPSERAAVLQQAAKIQTELGKCQRAAALCDWAQGQLMLVPQTPHPVSDSFRTESCTDVAVPDKVLSTLFQTSPQEHATPAEREHMIQALLAKSSHLLNTLS